MCWPQMTFEDALRKRVASIYYHPEVQVDDEYSVANCVTRIQQMSQQTSERLGSSGLDERGGAVEVCAFGYQPLLLGLMKGPHAETGPADSERGGRALRPADGGEPGGRRGDGRRGTRSTSPRRDTDGRSTSAGEGTVGRGGDTSGGESPEGASGPWLGARRLRVRRDGSRAVPLRVDTLTKRSHHRRGAAPAADVDKSLQKNIRSRLRRNRDQLHNAMVRINVTRQVRRRLRRREEGRAAPPPSSPAPPAATHDEGPTHDQVGPRGGAD